jgi:gas vesicle protein
MIEANNKMFMITFGMFILIVVIGFLATMFFAPTADTELTSLDFKSAKIKVKLQLMRAETDKQYYYNVQKGKDPSIFSTVF